MCYQKETAIVFHFCLYKLLEMGEEGFCYLEGLSETR